MRCKGSVLFLTAKTFAEKFLLPPSFFLYFAIPDIEQLIHIIYITISRRVDNKICFPLTTAVYKSCKRKSEKHSPAGWRDHTVGIENGCVLIFPINCLVCHNTFSYLCTHNKNIIKKDFDRKAYCLGRHRPGGVLRSEQLKPADGALAVPET